MPLNKRKARVLTNVKISEVSSCDHGAGEGCHVLIRKRDGKPDYEAFFGKFFGVKKKKDFGGYSPELCRAFAKNTDVSLPPLDEDEGYENPDDDEREDEGESDTDGESTDQLERAERAMKETKMKSHNQLMRDVIKRYGLIPFCKSVANGDVSVSEHELTKLICEAAERADTTFAKLFEAQDEAGVTLRKAIAAARDAQFFSRTSKAATLQPRQVGGADVDDPKAALDQINELVAIQRRANPTLSEAQAFAQVYTDPKNATLVARERKENRPVATAW
jgi:hypothetical protein